MVIYPGDPGCISGMEVMRQGEKERRGGEKGCGLERQKSKHRITLEAEKFMGFSQATDWQQR